MGEGQFGGDGSVKWVVTTERPFGGPGPRTDGAVDGQFGDDFVVRLRLPQGMTMAEFRSSAEEQGQYLVFRLPISPVAKQIHILWGAANTAAV